MLGKLYYCSALKCMNFIVLSSIYILEEKIIILCAAMLVEIICRETNSILGLYWGKSF